MPTAGPANVEQPYSPVFSSQTKTYRSHHRRTDRDILDREGEGKADWRRPEGLPQGAPEAGCGRRQGCCSLLSLGLICLALSVWPEGAATSQGSVPSPLGRPGSCWCVPGSASHRHSTMFWEVKAGERVGRG